MIERKISLEGISLIDFLGIQNANVRVISKAFPKTKVISRGSELVLKGSDSEIDYIESIIQNLISHIEKYGKLSKKEVESYVADDKTTALSKVNISDDVIVHGANGKAIKARTANQRKLVAAAKTNDIVFAVGPAGTGKTYTAVAIAVQALKDKKVKKIIITRPAVEAGENLGFLPGDLKEKIDPYLRPVYDSLHDMLNTEKLNGYIEKNIIEIAPLAYMRGRTLNDAFILLDEAQNTTSMQLKMFLTRMGPESKMMITGDITQIDLPRSQRSGLKDAYRMLRNIDGIKFIELDASDVVRHPLVVEILKAYEKEENSIK